MVKENDGKLAKLSTGNVKITLEKISSVIRVEKCLDFKAELIRIKLALDERSMHKMCKI